MFGASLHSISIEGRFAILLWCDPTGQEATQRLELDLIDDKQRRAILKELDKALNGRGRVVGIKRERGAACPVQAIVDLYHERLPMLPRIEVLNAKRVGYLRRLWADEDALPTLEHWGNYFAHVRNSDFLIGRAPPAPGRTTFIANLEWITTPSHYADIAEGRYHRRRA